MAFLDTNVFLYATGADHPNREPCRALLERLRTGTLVATTNTEVLQEIVFFFARRGRVGEGVRLARAVAELLPDLLPVTRVDLERAFELLGAHEGLPPRDAVNAATMSNSGITVIISADAHFDRMPGITRLHPAEVP
jgi:predicted nucleic acid-binding protein